jgi:hypothetical protein
MAPQMSIHENPDGSVSDGIKLEANGTFIKHEIGVVITSSAQLAQVASALTAGATQVIVQADCAPFTAANYVRYRLDGTAPTASTGIIIVAGASVTLNMTDAAAAKFIAVGTATLNASYTL